jgi:hypothetical protein
MKTIGGEMGFFNSGPPDWLLALTPELEELT